MPLVVLDPGHGGSDVAGKSNPLGLAPAGAPAEKQVTLDLATAVAGQLSGDVQLTRDTDVNLTLQERRGRAVGGTRAFVSLHASRSPSRRSEVWVHPRGNDASQRLASALAAALGGAPVRTDAEMAVLHPDGLADGLGACLVEADFDAVATAPGRRDVGTAIARGIRDFLQPGTGATPLGGRGRMGRRYGEADLVPAPYAPAGSTQAAQIIASWQSDLAEWVQGVPEAAHAVFPHSAICKLTLFLADGRTYVGTGFYIAPDRILTAAHCLHGPGLPPFVRIRVERALGALMSIPSFEVAAAGNFAIYPGYNPASFDTSFDLGLIRVPQGPLGGRYFALDELNFSPAGGITACGYPGQDGTESNNLQMSVAHDPNRQHVSRNHVVELFPNGEGFWTGTQAIGGVSGSPVFYSNGADVLGVAVVSAYESGRRLYQVCALTHAKIDWAFRKPFPATPWPPAYGARPAVGNWNAPVLPASPGARPGGGVAGGFVHPHGLGESYGRRAPRPRLGDRAPGSFGPARAVTPLTQPSQMTCWATCFAMLHGWKNQVPTTPRDAVRVAASAWLARFDADQFLPWDDYLAFAAATGLVADVPQNLTVEGWIDLLDAVGPVWADRAPAGNPANVSHIVVVVGVEYDGTSRGSRILFADPATGAIAGRPFEDWAREYEQLFVNQPPYMTPGRASALILHW